MSFKFISRVSPLGEKSSAKLFSSRLIAMKLHLQLHKTLLYRHFILSITECFPIRYTSLRPNVRIATESWVSPLAERVGAGGLCIVRCGVAPSELVGDRSERQVGSGCAESAPRVCRAAMAPALGGTWTGMITLQMLELRFWEER